MTPTMKKFEYDERVIVREKSLGSDNILQWPDDVIYWHKVENWVNVPENYHVVLWHGTLHRVRDENIFHLTEIN